VPVIVLADGMIGQMMEGIVLPPERRLEDLPKRDWTVGHLADQGRKEARHITSLDLVPENLEAKTRARFERYERIKKKEIRFEVADTEDADIILAAYGTSARVALGAKKLAEKAGIKVGLFRPITLWPFPYRRLAKIAESGKPILTVEMSLGQFVEDVKLSLLERAPDTSQSAVYLLGHSGGVIPTEEEVFERIKIIVKGNV
jgi:2-oxoglutarate ferredoxin oxidoreductase subunit alpha